MARDYDSTIARIAGNIASGLAANHYTAVAQTPEKVAQLSVAMARAIVAETKRTEPPSDWVYVPTMDEEKR